MWFPRFGPATLSRALGKRGGSGVVRASLGLGMGLPQNKLRAFLRAPKSCVSAGPPWGGDRGEIRRSLPQNEPGKPYSRAAGASLREHLPRGAMKAQLWQPLVLGFPLLGFLG